MVKTIWSDFVGLWRVCGPAIAMLWLLQIALHCRQCLRTRKLKSADLSMGNGPFTARRGAGAPVKLPGEWAIASVREIWVRDVYLGGGHLSLPSGASVVDLGANRGVFTALVLSQQPTATVVCVEPDRDACGHIRHMLKLNGWEDRVRVMSCFVGGETKVQAQMQTEENFREAPFLSEDQFIEQAGLTRIDYLKCDIEGSEFGLLTPESRLLRMARQVAVEVHDFAGPRGEFIEMLRAQGFEVFVHVDKPGDCIVHARR
jgi:FkbM family methyltransferase